MNKINLNILILALLCGTLFAQNDPAHPAPIDERIKSNSIKSVWPEQNTAEIYPVPVEVNYKNEFLTIIKNNFPVASFKAVTAGELRAAGLFNRLTAKYNFPELPVKVAGNIELKIDSREFKTNNPQAYKIKCSGDKIIVTGITEKALKYGVASLSQLVIKNENKIEIQLADVYDYPAYKRRMFNCNPVTNQLEDDLDWMAKYKIEAISFHNENFGWYGFDEKLKSNLKVFKKWTEKAGGVEAVLLMNMYRDETDIEVTNPAHIKLLKSSIRFAYNHGVSRILLFADDSPPFKFGEGYYLDSENDKKKFSCMAEAHAYLMNHLLEWSRKEKMEIEFYYCPSFYTAEEMHYGDMELFKDTPWEEDAFGPLKRDLGILGEKLDKDIQIMWTGPYVCTRKITVKDIERWKKYLHGRTPFLFDNSIFSHLEYTARTFFTAFGNDFPYDFKNITAGNGIFINGDATGETSKSASMTATAFMWEGERYKDKASIITAMQKLYGKENVNTLLKYKDVELELCKTIKQRQVWFAADELWQTIRTTRFTTEKNPFHYHRNYGRLKALRMQLKHSVPEPVEKEIHIKKCSDLFNQREKLLRKIEAAGLQKLSISLQSEMISLPDFENEK